MDKKISLLKLYLIFLKIGAILLGGGYVILPIITDELSKKHKLLPEDEIVNYFALSQSLPGIVAANISMFTGYKLSGKSGAVVSMLGIITVPFISIILLATILNTFSNNIYLKGALSGVEVAVIVLLILTVKELWQKSKVDLFFCLIFILSLCGLVFLKFSPIQTIVVFTIFGIFLKTFFKKEDTK